MLTVAFFKKRGLVDCGPAPRTEEMLRMARV
jgi:hypothetical protein